MPSKISYDEFLKRARSVHGDKYDYSNVDLSKGFHSPVKIICPIHGEFYQTPVSHVRGSNCPKCSVEKVHNEQKKTTEKFKEDARKIFGNRYDFSKVNYTGAQNKVCVICPEHGEFWIRPNDLLNGHGCSACSRTRPLTTQVFIDRAKKIFGDKYSYENVVYKNLGTHVSVTCPQHGDFPVTPRNFLNGYGCPKCSQSHLERSVEVFLNQNNVDFIYQYKPEWGRNYRFDFYLPEYKTIIECQGRQHFSSIDYFKGDSGFEYLKKNDAIKNELCKQHGINVFYLLYSRNVVIPEDLRTIYNGRNVFYEISDMWKILSKKAINQIEEVLKEAIKNICS